MPYLGEIRLFAGNFAPIGWLMCDGSLVPINENEALYTLIGTAYGGDGVNTFAVPDLRGRVPIHQSSTHLVGETGGAEAVSLTVQQIPSHSHAMVGINGPATTRSPANAYLAEPARDLYAKADTAPHVYDTSAPSGGVTAHENMMPFLTINFIIAFEGVFPTQT